jgi:hypothetical protein
MNRKADVPMLLIPVVAVALCLAALFAFASFNGGLEERSDDLARLTGNVAFNENYIRAQAKLIWNETLGNCPNCGDAQLKEKFIEIAKEKESLFRDPGTENFYGRVFRGEFNVTSSNLSIDGLFMEEKVANNKIKRNFNIQLETASI